MADGTKIDVRYNFSTKKVDVTIDDGDSGFESKEPGSFTDGDVDLYEEASRLNKIFYPPTNPMTINEYQDKAIATAIYGAGYSIVYPTLGIAGEAGEVADKVKKILRDNNGEFTDEKKLEIAKEIGDVCWYIAALCRDLGFSMDEVCQMNLDKLASRKARNVIAGSGDNR